MHDLTDLKASLRMLVAQHMEMFHSSHLVSRVYWKQSADIVKKAADAIDAQDAEIAALKAERERMAAALPDDIRAAGWTVAVHNDYQQNGVSHTFWLFTKNGRAVKGEGLSDAEALNQVRAALSPTKQ